jgi:hypothetical protein
METLESSVIRHLILTAKLPSGQISDIVRNVLQTAVGRGLLREAPEIHYGCPLADKVTEVIWELIMEGVYAPGLSMQSPNLPFIRATEYGLRCFAAGELTAHDPDDYSRRLKVACPTIDETTLLYTGESLNSYRAGNHLASTVMIGVAAEKMLLRLIDAVHASLSTTARKAKFAKDTAGKKAKVQHDEVLARLRSPATSLPPEIESVLTSHVDGIYDLIRRTRNDAGHPPNRQADGTVRDTRTPAIVSDVLQDGSRFNGLA